MELYIGHCQQSHGYLGPEQTKPLGETECPSDMVGVLLLPLRSQVTLASDYELLLTHQIERDEVEVEHFYAL